MTEGAEHAKRILVCRSGVYDDAILAAFAGQAGIQLELVASQDVSRRLEAAHALLIRNSDYDGRIGKAVHSPSADGLLGSVHVIVVTRVVPSTGDVRATARDARA